MAATARSDAETLRVLEEVRPRYERLRAASIRNEAEIERCQRDHAEAAAAARELFGTDDEAEIRTMIEARRAESAAAVDAFSAEVARIEAELAALDAQPA